MSFAHRLRRATPSLGLLLAAVIACQPLATRAADKAARTGQASSAAHEAAPPALDNAYAPFVGEPFFLLSDATFASDEVAKVRLEVNSPQSLEDVGGVDVRVYRITDPLAFLQRQKNLHRIQVEGRPADEGLGNTLTHLWDSWVVKSRMAWQKIFSVDARRAVVAQAPALKTPAGLNKPSTFEAPSQFRPLAGLPLVQRLRYPVQSAKAIEPPKDVKLAGSSSDFIKPTEGNVFVPLGKQAPGLYLVEAAAGQYRATTLLFVADTVALTKVSDGQMLVWTAQRASGAPVPASRVVWSDGIGVLQSATADGQGIARLEHKAPEQTYVFGTDPAGGVFVSENFYYDSEIYNAKVYAVTDRPLYRPGDWVDIKVTGREFRNARESTALKDADIALGVVDPAGQVIHTQSFHFSGAQGGDTRFALPDNARAGGYELRLTMGDDTYTAAFRVADYQKPHFEIGLLPDKADFKTGEPVAGKLQLNYPDGKPVANARVSLTARVQKLTMVEGELDYGGKLAVKLTQNELQTDASGTAKFALPAASEPSRYVLTALATDGAAYRVRTTKEVLVERGGGSYRLVPDRQFSKAGDAVMFKVTPSRNVGATTAALPSEMVKPARWEYVRLENGAKGSGAMSSSDAVSVTFPLPGSYTLTLRDDKERIVAATSHWVSGEGLRAPAGSIGMVFNRASYHAGDTAEVLVSFPEPIDDALVTLEREQVQALALTGRRADWLRSERIAPTQWKLAFQVTEAMSPNMTLSVAYVKHGDYVFQNQGLLVEQPRVAISFRTDKPVYAPGETVQVDVTTALAGKPAPAEVTVGVVDEMIYVLQPEIAPSIDDFFYHPRRNNVRTSASLSFIGYDLATGKLGSLPSARQVNERAVKVLERPRRDNVDTAAWQPRLTTDATGHAHFTFTMPDSLTRWRITGRAVEAGGAVGQQVAYVRSDKAFFAKWTSPDWLRVGDRAVAAVALFNQTGKPAEVEWQATGAGVDRKATLTVQPGVNFVSLPLAADAKGAGTLSFVLRQQGRVVDRLDTPLQRLPVAWPAPRESALDMSSGSAALNLPADATRVRVAFAQDAAAGAFNRITEDLIDFPYGCVEQTASRMLPMSIALQSLSPVQQPLAPMLSQRLASARLALAQMAGPDARFGWWGRGMVADGFLTAYAYYADWRAATAMHLTLPASHWQRLLDVYAKLGEPLPPLQRALMLAWMQEMGLPVGAMNGKLVEQLAAAPFTDAAPLSAKRGSLVLQDSDPVDTHDIAVVLAVNTAGLANATVAPPSRAAANAAAERLAKVEAPFVQSLLLYTGRVDAAQAGGVLQRVSADMPTFDRAQSLLWLQRAVGDKPSSADDGPSLPAPWQRSTSVSGATSWQLPPAAPLPATLTLPAGMKAAWAFVSYESGEAQAPALLARVERTLWRVVPQARAPGTTVSSSSAGSAASAASRAGRASDAASSGAATKSAAIDGRLDIKLERVAPGTALDSDTLYLDALTLTAAKDMRWAVVDAALPPGATVESSTWGLDLGTEGHRQPLERAQDQPTAQGYAVPLEALPAGRAVTVRHLVRFSQRGTFKLPPVRLHRMYDPEAKAFDTSGRWAEVEVR